MKPDFKNINAIKKKLEEAKKKSIAVGVFSNRNARDGLSSNAEIAAAHEYGVPGRIPERSFLRATLKEEGRDIADKLASQLLKAVTTNGDTKTPFELTGLYVAGRVKSRIIQGIEPALDAKTIKRKGSSKPLIDTGQLLQSITYEVRDES